MGNPDEATPVRIVAKLTEVAQRPDTHGCSASKGKICVSPGIGFGDQGDSHMRFALIENESRIRRAMRGIRRCFKAVGSVSTA